MEWNFKEMAEEYGDVFLMMYYPDDVVFEMEYFDEYYANHSPLDIVWRVRNGYSWSPNDNIRREFNPNEEYFTFNGYVNPVSISESLLGEYLMSCIDEDEFKDWCIENGYFEGFEEV